MLTLHLLLAATCFAALADRYAALLATYDSRRSRPRYTRSDFVSRVRVRCTLRLSLSLARFATRIALLERLPSALRRARTAVPHAPSAQCFSTKLARGYTTFGLKRVRVLLRKTKRSSLRESLFRSVSELALLAIGAILPICSVADSLAGLEEPSGIKPRSSKSSFYLAAACSARELPRRIASFSQKLCSQIALACKCPT